MALEKQNIKKQIGSIKISGMHFFLPNIPRSWLGIARVRQHQKYFEFLNEL